MTPQEFSLEVEAALREIVAAYGQEALSEPMMMSNLLKDLLPEAPGIARMLVTAAEDHIADQLAGHVSQGLDAPTAVRLTASSFAGSTMFAPEACAWVVSEFAITLGLITDGRVGTVVVPPPSEQVTLSRSLPDPAQDRAHDEYPTLTCRRPSGPGAPAGSLPEMAAGLAQPAGAQAPAPGTTRAAARRGHALRLLNNAEQIAYDIDRTYAANWSNPFSPSFPAYRNSDRENALAFIAHGMARTDPARAESMARSLTAQQPKALASVADIVVQTDPVHAVRLLDDALHYLRRQGHDSRDEAPSGRGRAELDGILALAAQEHVAIGSDQWTLVREPKREFCTFAEQCVLVVDSITMGKVIHAAARTDPAAAAQLLDGAQEIARSLPPDIRNRLLIAIAEVAAASDADYAERIARDIRTKDEQAEALARVASALTRTDAARALRIARGLSGKFPALQVTRTSWAARALIEIAKSLEHADPAQAAQLLAEAGQVARSTKNSHQSATALIEIARTTARTDPGRAHQLLAESAQIARQITDSTSREEALACLAEVTADLDPARAELIARSITTEHKRAQALRRVVEVVAGTDPARAEKIARSITFQDQMVESFAYVAVMTAKVSSERASHLLAEAEQIANSFGAYQQVPSMIKIAEAAAIADPARAEEIANGIAFMDLRIRALVSIAIAWLDQPAAA